MSELKTSVRQGRFVAAIAVLVFAATSSATIYNVPGDFPTIQAAIAAVKDGDEIVVAPGVYNENINFLGKAIIVRSSDGADVTTIDGTGLGDTVVKCLSGEGPDTILDGFTITGGSAHFGGGMFILVASPTVTNCLFTRNVATNSGGAAGISPGSSPSFIDCVFQDCDAVFAGAVAVLNASVTINRCAFQGNTADSQGGGMYISSGEATINGCSFQGNTAGSQGGGIYISSGEATINGCSFQGNTARSQGGAIFASGASVTFVNTEFDGNHAEDDVGGGVSVLGGEVTISGCSFTGNSASAGGGLRIDGNARLTCTDSWFTENLSAVDGGAIITDSVHPASRISGCQFTNNEAGQGGGGVAFADDFPEISNCVFQGNGAGFGGGVHFRNFNTTKVENVVFLDNTAFFGGGVEVDPGNSPEFVNCLFAGNSATAGGGDPASGGGLDIYGSGATSTMVNCTFSGNSSAEFGGAVNVSLDAHVQLVGCVLWGNNAPSGAEIRISNPPPFEGGTVTVSYSDVAGGEGGVSIGKGGTLNWGDGNIDRDPLFVDPDGPDDDPDTYQDNDYRLGVGSQAIDAADNTAVPNDMDTDLDGNARFFEDRKTPDTGLGDCPIVDMGAYEFHEFQGTCPWDLDCNNDSVGLGDLLILLGAWGPNPGHPADFDSDGNVGVSDLLALLANWGPCP